MGLIDLGLVKGATGATGDTGAKGDTGARGVGISTVEQITGGVRFCLTNGTNFDIELTPPTTPASVSLTSNKSILSYADSESATLSATVLDSDSEPLENVSVEFFKGSTSLGTADTNSSGVATKTYASAGAGDLSFTAKAGGVTSTGVNIEDCYVYDTTEHSHTQSGSTATSTDVLNNFTWDNTSNWKATCNLKVSANAQRIDILPPTETRNHHLGIGKNGSGNGSIYVGKATSGENYTTFNGFNNNTYYPVEISKTGTSVTFKFDGNTITQSYDSSWLSNYNTETIVFTQWGSGTVYVKDLKIKKT